MRRRRGTCFGTSHKLLLEPVHYPTARPFVRQRYWSVIFYAANPTLTTDAVLSLRLRSYLGYPSVRDALPNTTHFALAALQHTSFVPRLITQVGALHFWLGIDVHGLGTECRWASSKGSPTESQVSLGAGPDTERRLGTPRNSTCSPFPHCFRRSEN